MRYLLLIAVLVLGAGGYSGYWLLLANSIEREAARLLVSPPEPIETLRHDRFKVEGFPYRLTAKIDRPALILRQGKTALTWKGPNLTVFTHPWTLDHVVGNFAGSHRIGIDQDGYKTALALDLQSAQASRVGAQGELGRIDIDLRNAVVTLPENLGLAKLARARFNIRQTPDQHNALQLALRLEQLQLPDSIAALSPNKELKLAELHLRFLEKPPKRFDRATLARWRDDGGTLEVDLLRLQWPGIAISAKGTLALDAQFRLSGALSAVLKGHTALIEHLAGLGVIPADQVALSKLTLALMAAANNGTLKLPLRLQDGMAWLGPLQLARLAPII